MTIKMTESLTGIQTEREDRHTSVICPRQNRCLPLFPNKRIHFLTQNPKAGLDCTLCGTLQGRVTVDSKVQEGGRQPTRDISCLKLKQILILSKLRHLIQYMCKTKLLCECLFVLLEASSDHPHHEEGRHSTRAFALTQTIHSLSVVSCFTNARVCLNI